MACLFLIGCDVSAQPAVGAALHGCADDAGRLRLTEANVPCGPAERRLRLTPPRIDENRSCEEDVARAEKLENRIRDLQYRARRGTLRGARVVAPFDVVTEDGKRLLNVVEQNVTFYNLDGKPVVWIIADRSGGYLLTQSTTGLVAGLGAQDDLGRVRIQEQDRDRILLGRTVARESGGRYSLQVLGSNGRVIAGIGQSRQGGGLVVIADREGNVKVRMRLSEDGSGDGVVQVANVDGTDVGFLATGSRGGGLLRLTDASGQPMVEAGTVDDVGVVRTGPNMRNPGVGIAGQVPSFIIGLE